MKNSLLDVAITDLQFKLAYEYGISNKLIENFPQKLMQKTNNVYLYYQDCSLYDYFMTGQNIGHCLEACDYLTRIFKEWEVYTGILPAIKNTLNSPNGEHAWFVSKGKVYDTSLLLVIDESLLNDLGYHSYELVNKRPQMSKTPKSFIK